MRLAVTGATGLVGRAVLRECARRGHDVLALVRRTDAPELEGRRVTAQSWLLEDAGRKALPAGIDCFVHLAAFIPPAMDDPSFANQCLRLNALAAGAAIESVARSGVRHAVFASTGSLYVNHGRLARESDPVYPSPHAPFYLASKLAGEVFASAAASRAGITLASLRIASVYGAEIRPQSVVRRFLTEAAEGASHEIRDPRHAADFVFVDDVAQVILSAAENQASGIINVGSGKRTSIAEMSYETLRIFGRAAIEPTKQDSPAASGFPALDLTRACAELGFAPTPLPDGLRLTAQALSLL